MCKALTGSALKGEEMHIIITTNCNSICGYRVMRAEEANTISETTLKNINFKCECRNAFKEVILDVYKTNIKLRLVAEICLCDRITALNMHPKQGNWHKISLLHRPRTAERRSLFWKVKLAIWWSNKMSVNEVERTLDSAIGFTQ